MVSGLDWNHVCTLSDVTLRKKENVPFFKSEYFECKVQFYASVLPLNCYSLSTNI